MYNQAVTTRHTSCINMASDWSTLVMDVRLPT
jgi:hypothetical protein